VNITILSQNAGGSSDSSLVDYPSSLLGPCKHGKGTQEHIGDSVGNENAGIRSVEELFRRRCLLQLLILRYSLLSERERPT